MNLTTNDKFNLNESIPLKDNIKIYKTGKVSEILGLDSTKVRYYANYFADFLELKSEESNKGKHRLFTPLMVNKLKFILKLSNENNMELSEIKEYLNTPEGKLMQPINSNNKSSQIFMDAIINELNETIKNTIKSEVKKIIDVIPPLLLYPISEQQKEMENKIMNKLDKIDSNTIDNKKVNEELIKKIEERSERVENLIKDVRSRQIESSRKKSIFNFFKKKR